MADAAEAAEPQQQHVEPQQEHRQHPRGNRAEQQEPEEAASPHSEARQSWRCPALSMLYNIGEPKSLPALLDAARWEANRALPPPRPDRDHASVGPPPVGWRLSQIQLIYRAEGNANLVLALPQFKKVLRLPKVPTGRSGGVESAPGRGGRDAGVEGGSPSSCASNQQRAGGPAAAEQQPEWQTTGPSERNASGSMAAAAQPERRQQQLQQDANGGELSLTHFAAYVECLRRLTGPQFLPSLDVVALPDAEDREWINSVIRPFRPAHRHHKEFCGQFGLLLPDATELPATFDTFLSNLQAAAASRSMTAHGRSGSGAASCDPASHAPTTSAAPLLVDASTYAVEIKPKQGWLLPTDVNDLFDIVPATTTTTRRTPPTSSAQSAATSLRAAHAGKAEKEAPADGERRRHAARCRFCAMQYLKLQNGKIHELSEYCPLELFSGVRDRMLRSLEALLKCPQNNLRIFRNGKLIYGDHDGSLSWPQLQQDIFIGDKLELIKHLLLTCLLREYGESAAVGAPAMPKGADRTTTTTTTTMTPASAAPSVGPAADCGAGGGGQDAGDVEKAVIAGQPHSNIVTAATTTTGATTTTTTRAVVGATTARTTTTRATPAQNIKVMKVSEEAAAVAAEAEVRTTKTTGKTTTTSTRTTTKKPAAIMAIAAVAGRTPPMDRMAGALSRTAQASPPPPRQGSSTTTTTATTPSGGGDAPKGRRRRVAAQISEAEMPPLGLPPNCVLQKILHLQLFAKDNLRHLLRQGGAAAKTTKSYDMLEELLSSGSDFGSTARARTQGPKQDGRIALTPRTAYLLGATALDCSLMVAFREVEVPSPHSDSELNGHLVHLADYERSFLTSALLLDLDPKPDSHLAKYVEQTRQAIAASVWWE